jgi:hypothetical protein
MPAGNDNKGGSSSSRDKRVERLGEALRRNLRRRKEAQRADDPAAAAGDEAETGGNAPKGGEQR